MMNPEMRMFLEANLGRKAVMYCLHNPVPTYLARAPAQENRAKFCLVWPYEKEQRILYPYSVVFGDQFYSASKQQGSSGGEIVAVSPENSATIKSPAGFFWRLDEILPLRDQIKRANPRVRLPEGKPVTLIREGVHI